MARPHLSISPGQLSPVGPVAGLHTLSAGDPCSVPRPKKIREVSLPATAVGSLLALLLSVLAPTSPGRDQSAPQAVSPGPAACTWLLPPREAWGGLCRSAVGEVDESRGSHRIQAGGIVTPGGRGGIQRLKENPGRCGYPEFPTPGRTRPASGTSRGCLPTRFRRCQRSRPPAAAGEREASRGRMPKSPGRTAKCRGWWCMGLPKEREVGMAGPEREHSPGPHGSRRRRPSAEEGFTASWRRVREENLGERSASASCQQETGAPAGPPWGPCDAQLPANQDQGGDVI